MEEWIEKRNEHKVEAFLMLLLCFVVLSVRTMDIESHRERSFTATFYLFLMLLLIHMMWGWSTIRFPLLSPISLPSSHHAFCSPFCLRCTPKWNTSVNMREEDEHQIHFLGFEKAFAREMLKTHTEQNASHLSSSSSSPTVRPCVTCNKLWHKLQTWSDIVLLM